MTAFTLGQFQAWESHTRMPRQGAWTSEVRADYAGVASVGPVSLSVGELVLAGFVVQSGVALNEQRCLIVGGKGGLGKLVAPQSYRRVTVRQVVSDLLASVGETLAPNSTAAILSTVLNTWSTTHQTAGAALSVLAETVLASSRVQPSGAVWFGLDSYPFVDGSAMTLEHDEPEHCRSVFGVDSPYLLPGTKLNNTASAAESNVNNRPIESVEHHCSSEGCKTVVLWGTP